MEQQVAERTERHIANRQAPASVMARLREIDSRAELLYLGDGAWMLGVLNPNSGVTTGAWASLLEERSLPAAEQRPARVKVLLAIVERGFRPIATYEPRDPREDIFARIVEDFRIRDWNYRMQREKAFRESLRRSELDADSLVQRMATMRDAVHAEARAIWRYAVKGARSFLQRVSLN